MPTHQQRLAARAARALTSAFDALDCLLARCDPEAAAAIVADLLKAQMARPVPEPDPMVTLAGVVETVRRGVEAANVQHEQRQPEDTYTPPWLRPDNSTDDAPTNEDNPDKTLDSTPLHSQSTQVDFAPW